jgi:acyl-CoA synthetase (AMP-forming)/AMP-acid ligase II
MAKFYLSRNLPCKPDKVNRGVQRDSLEAFALSQKLACAVTTFLIHSAYYLICLPKKESIEIRRTLGGWLLHTNDIGFIDSDGYPQVTDRIKDVIKTGGE